MKTAAVLVLGPVGLVELLLRLIVVVLLVVSFLALFMEFDADDIYYLLTPASWALLRELAGVKA